MDKAGRRSDQSRSGLCSGAAPRRASSIVNVRSTIHSGTSIAHPQSLTMLRQQMLRSLKRPAARAALNGSRAFTASARRPAEVELTIGLCHYPLRLFFSANELRRWQEGFSRRYADLSICSEATETILTPSNSWLRPHPGLRKGRSYHPTILLPREADDCWKLPHVLG